MHVLLTDVLTCPRCGPDFGLILLADQVENRRVIAGSLGCANCREQFRVAGGFCDLRVFTETETETETETGSAEYALRIAAMLGVTEGPALVLVVGSGAANATAIADLVPNLEVVAAWTPLAAASEQPGVSRIGINDTLPLRSGSMRGIALTDAASAGLIEEAARVVALRGRVVVLSSAPESVERLTRAGLRMVAADEQAAVAERVKL